MRFISAAAAPVTTAIVGTGLAVRGTVSNYNQRVAEQVAAGKSVNKLKTFGVAVMDTFGLSGLMEAITGKRLLTGERLSSAQAGGSMGSGVASVAAMAAGSSLVKSLKPVLGKIADPIETAVVNAVTTVKSAVGSFFSKAVQAVSSAFSGKPENPLGSIQCSRKIVGTLEEPGQMTQGPGEHHPFPSLVDNYGSLGKKTTIVGNDGIARTKLEISGGYNGKSGVFQYIIEPNGTTVDHRLFVPSE